MISVLPRPEMNGLRFYVWCKRRRPLRCKELPDGIREEHRPYFFGQYCNTQLTTNAYKLWYSISKQFWVQLNLSLSAVSFRQQSDISRGIEHKKNAVTLLGTGFDRCFFAVIGELKTSRTRGRLLWHEHVFPCSLLYLPSSAFLPAQVEYRKKKATPYPKNLQLHVDLFSGSYALLLINWFQLDIFCSEMAVFPLVYKYSIQ